MTTLSALSAFANRKLEVGDDVSVLGFDDYPWMTARRTSITAVDQPIDAVVDNVWSTLSKRLRGNSGPAEAIELQCTLAVRASTRRVAPREAITRNPQMPSRGSAGKGTTKTTRRKPIH